MGEGGSNFLYEPLVSLGIHLKSCWHFQMINVKLQRKPRQGRRAGGFGEWWQVGMAVLFYALTIEWDSDTGKANWSSEMYVFPEFSVKFSVL